MPTFNRIAALLVFASSAIGSAAAQLRPQPTQPLGAAVSPAWLDRGAQLLTREDPLQAWRVFRDARPIGEQYLERTLGLGRAHLMLGNADSAVAHGESSLAAAPDRQDAMALMVRSLIRSRRFDDAVDLSTGYLARAATPSARLLAARGSSLFRVQRTSDAAQVYREVVAADRDHAEAHLRLGSGLTDPVVVDIPQELRLAVGAIAAGRRQQAIDTLHAVLDDHPGHPVAHRLLGETLFAERTASCMAMQDAAFQALAAQIRGPDARRLPISAFVPAYRDVSAQRRRVIERTAAVFATRLAKLIQVGGRHDLLNELERTTDARARRELRGRRTFDGRVWDDVRGIGGLRAATGIEALDEAACFGFDTFAHEVAHQVHFFTFSPLERARLRALYKQAVREQRCLDYYAASNEAEYFGQGVEAFVSLAKRPGSEVTHGHTRWELQRVDPKLYSFISGLVDFDPLLDEGAREAILRASVAAALRCGRPEDAQVALQLLSPGPERRRLVAETEQVLRELQAR